ncbi:putative FMN-dependent luciferase-like monooxygenase [Paracraurococcus lichenis]|uniref:FMN-dependent luciferase-like monooxygenase n=1 Tax=Paracraurococcus lichenis TaxID=3064888 RepID=A0ABT9E5N2_9PROT|nr:putative FMN-dependent luciferase-like monooxygenase [Paracraurococcus sp. LOR1-02]MDO9711476.1 putative FMN-dependent luciferase-like monooxygenase [Paracraurococcus sp. LOR1-02]
MSATRRLGFFTRLLDEGDAGERYRLAAVQVRHAEAEGFDSAWVAQHHFHADEGGLPSPFVFLAQLAGQTSRIRLGTGVVTLPLEQPIRVAEDAAVLDLLSGGRLELGLGSGGNPDAFAAFGLSDAGRREVFAERLEALLKALAGKALKGGDPIYPSRPALLERLWYATFSAEGGRRAGELGAGLLLSRTQPRPAGTPELSLAAIQEPIIEAYLAALPAGATPRILASRSVFVTDRRETAWDHAATGLPRFHARLVRLGRAPAGAPPPLEALVRRQDVHLGTAEEVVASLRADPVLRQATDLAVQVHSVDPPHELTLRSIELVARQVAPALGFGRDG